MATNGLRYGAQVELRENWDSTTPSGGFLNNTSASGMTSAQSMFVRRAFVYAAGAQWGIVRFGQGDGVLGIFDNGVTSMQSVSPSGGMNGSDVQQPIPANMYMPFPFYAQNGIEYGNQKLVYLSPSFAGLDLGLEYAPSNNNAEIQGLCGDGVTTTPATGGVSGVNGATCSTTASSPLASDAIRYTNQFEAGARYQGTFGPVAVLAHATYLGTGVVDFTGLPPSTAANAGNPHGWNGKYDPISLVQGGVAVTVAGLTVGGLINHGAMNNNGQGTPKPQGSPNQTAFIIGFQYNNGPLAVGLAYQQADSQGSGNLVGVSQRHEWGVNPGVDWLVAPGFKVFAEYFYGERHQGDFNFATGAINNLSYTAGSNNNPGAYNNVTAQALLVGTRVYW
jgi:predicted porin